MLGCQTAPVSRNRTFLAQDIAASAGFTREYIKAGDFTLLTYRRFEKRSDIIDIYIEGDGRPAAHDPTPLDPLALRLAVLDPADNVAYIARPGQYPLSSILECDPKYWSTYRFAPEVIDSINKAIDLEKQVAHARHVKIIGYSGGGAIAVLAASKRDDVMSIRTVASPLKSSLLGSLDPKDAAMDIAQIPQRHFVGSRDRVVPQSIVWSFVQQEGEETANRVTIVKGVSHTDGWVERWKYLLSLSPS